MPAQVIAFPRSAPVAPVVARTYYGVTRKVAPGVRRTDCFDGSSRFSGKKDDLLRSGLVDESWLADGVERDSRGRVVRMKRLQWEGKSVLSFWKDDRFRVLVAAAGAVLPLPLEPERAKYLTKLDEFAELLHTIPKRGGGRLFPSKEKALEAARGTVEKLRALVAARRNVIPS